jgi:pimeloyl-ACP methyl ester carboxylesterase
MRILRRHIAVVVIIFVAGAAIRAADEDPASHVHQVTLPMPETEAEVRQLVEQFAELAGNYGVDISHDIVPDPEQAVQAIGQASNGIFSVERRDDGKCVIRVDRLRMRRENKQLRTTFRTYLTKKFPEYAKQAKARYGMTFYDAEGKACAVPKSLAHSNRYVVVMVHGLDEPGLLWQSAVPALLDNNYQPIEFKYPNDQPIHNSAELLGDCLAELRKRGVTRVSIVSHSMGGLVSRELLTHPDLYGGEGSGHDKYPDVQRLVMIGTPNYGSKLAHLRFASEARDQVVQAFSGDGVLFGSIFDGAGEAGIDLLPESKFLTELNGRPHPKRVALTIISGRASPLNEEKISIFSKSVPATLKAAVDKSTSAWKDLVAGVGDGAVTLASSKLKGVDDFVVVAGNHLTMIRSVNGIGDALAVPIIVDRLDKTRVAE